MVRYVVCSVQGPLELVFFNPPPHTIAKAMACVTSATVILPSPSLSESGPWSGTDSEGGARHFGKRRHRGL